MRPCQETLVGPCLCCLVGQRMWWWAKTVVGWIEQPILSPSTSLSDTAPAPKCGSSNAPSAGTPSCPKPTIAATPNVALGVVFPVIYDILHALSEDGDNALL
mmetsp:Transcript_29251/g.58492  ORF Transcript_29251/g.58492 Transcript_29251/m.58492 type:complete len:102 (+) Transcript_29251:243-548(+)